MKEPFEVKGQWWVAEHEENKISGILSYSQENGAVLDLSGLFMREPNNRSHRPPIILGESVQGDEFTIVAPILQSSSIQLARSSSGISSYISDLMFEGIHFAAKEEILFRDIAAEFTDLAEWVNISGFKSENGENNGEEATIRYQLPVPITKMLNDEIEVGVGFSSNQQFIGSPPKEARIIQKSHIVVSAKNNDVSFDVLSSYIDRFSVLQQLAVQRLTYPISIVGRTRSHFQELDGAGLVYLPIKIYYTPLEPYREQKVKHPSRMLFTFKDIDEENILNWFALYEAHKTRIELYRSLFYRNRLFLNTRFLHIAEALASLHGKLNQFDDNHLPEEEFSSRLQKVIDAIPSNLQTWVEGSLVSGKGKRFAERIQELLDYKSSLLGDAIQDNEQFVVRVRDTRNEFVHQGIKKKTFRDSRELFCSITLLTYLFEAYLLEIIGLPNEKIREIYKKRMSDYLTWGLRL